MRILETILGLTLILVGGFLVLMVLAFSTMLDPGHPGHPEVPRDPKMLAEINLKIAQGIAVPVVMIAGGLGCLWDASRTRPGEVDGGPA